jgi:hypothetical protein
MRRSEEVTTAFRVNLPVNFRVRYDLRLIALIRWLKVDAVLALKWAKVGCDVAGLGRTVRRLLGRIRAT